MEKMTWFILSIFTLFNSGSARNFQIYPPFPYEESKEIYDDSENYEQNETEYIQNSSFKAVREYVKKISVQTLTGIPLKRIDRLEVPINNFSNSIKEENIKRNGISENIEITDYYKILILWAFIDVIIICFLLLYCLRNCI